MAQEYGHFLKHPELFHAPSVGKATAKDLRASGYKVTPKGRAIIPLNEFKSASIDHGKIVYDSGRMKETVHLVGHKTFFQKLKSLSGKKLERNEMLTVQIGDNHAFKRARFGSYAELYKYLNEWAPKDPGESRDKLLAKMSIVHVYSRRKETSHAKKKATSKKKRRS